MNVTKWKFTFGLLRVNIAMYFVHFVVFQALYLSIWTDLFITCRYQAVVLKILLPSPSCMLLTNFPKFVSCLPDPSF